MLRFVKKKKCIDYISTIGAKKYLKNEKLFLDNNIKLNFYKFNYKEYNQIGKNFIENLSFLDLFFNLGTDSINYLRENFKIINE